MNIFQTVINSQTTSGTESPPPLDHHEFGLWDAIYNAGSNHQAKGERDSPWTIFSPTAGIVTVLNSAKRWTPVDKQELDKVSFF